MKQYRGDALTPFPGDYGGGEVAFMLKITAIPNRKLGWFYGSKRSYSK
jgi:hypothetical protein